MLDLLSAPASGGTPSIATYGPILAGIASLAAVLVSLFSRKDKQRTDFESIRTTQADTAIKGLSEAYDRVNAERKEESDRADRAETRAATAESRMAQLEVARQHLESENDLLRARLEETRTLVEKHHPAVPPRKRAVKKTTMKKATRRPRE